MIKKRDSVKGKGEVYQMAACLIPCSPQILRVSFSKRVRKLGMRPGMGIAV